MTGHVLRVMAILHAIATVWREPLLSFVRRACCLLAPLSSRAPKTLARAAAWPLGECARESLVPPVLLAHGFLLPTLRSL